MTIENLHDSYEAKVGFELATPESEVRCPTKCTMEPGYDKFSYFAPNHILWELIGFTLLR